MPKSENRKKILNSKTGRMVYIDGVVGKKLLAEAHKLTKKTKPHIKKTSSSPITKTYQISGAKISNWMDNKVPKSYWDKKWIMWTTKERRKINPLIKYLIDKGYGENALYKAPNPPGNHPENTYQFGVDFVFTNTELLAIKHTDTNVTKKFIKYFGFENM